MSDAGAAQLTVLLDVRHALAALALGPTLAFAREEDVEVDWLPLETPPLKAPSQPGPHDDRSQRHRRYRAESIAREIETYAAAQGIEMRDYYRDADPIAAHLAWLWVRERDAKALPAFLARLFRAYWAQDLDPSDFDAVTQLLAAEGIELDGFRDFASRDGRSLLAVLDAEMRARGVQQVPGYVLGDEIFWGRQHLPMIRFILNGRVGRGPI